MCWALAALLGNVVLHRLPALPSGPLLVVLAVAASVLLAAPRLRPVAIGLVYFCLAAGAASDRLADRLESDAGQIDVDLTGWVDDFPRREALRTVFTLRVTPSQRSVRSARGRRNDADDSVKLPARVRLTWYEPPLAIEAGMSLAVRARLRPPHGLVNPGGFDYERWLLTENIGATGYVRSGALDPQASHGLAQSWLAYRARLGRAIASSAPEQSAAALLSALGIGLRTGLSDEQWTVLRRTGTTHLVAISGLHIGLVAVFAFELLLRVQLRIGGHAARHARPVAAVAALVPAALYAALAGFELPTLRALAMLAVAQVVVLSRRRVAPSTGLSLAALVVLATDPLAPLGASFWLSFGAVAAIVAGLSRQPRSTSVAGGRMARCAAGFATLCRLQLVIGVALLPLAALHFSEVSIAAFVVNPIAVPFFSFVLVPATLLLVAASAAGIEAAAAVIASAAAALIDPVWTALTAVAAIPASAVAVPRPSGIGLTVATIGAASFVLNRSRLRWLGLGGLAALAIRAPDRPPRGGFDLTTLDVGHGLAVVVRTATHSLLFDTGPLSRTGFDAGREIVIPALAELTPGRLDRIVVSHGDSDHAGGLPSLRDAFPETRTLVGPDVAAVDAAVCETGQQWSWDDVGFRILHPAAEFSLRGNESSCVLLIESAGGRALLTGDIEAHAEMELVANGLPRVDILVAPHHGSATSSTAPFVAATRPEHVVVSAGHRNRWNFPRPQVVQRWQAVGSSVRSTGDDGAILARVSLQGTHVTGMRETKRRYWIEDSGAGGGSAL